MRITTLLLLLALAACSGDPKGSDTGTADTMVTDTMDTDTMMSGECVTDICATYGAAVPLVAGQITDAAATDPEFSADFAALVAEGPAAVDAFKASLANFISDAYGCSSGAYTGPTMVDVHTGLAITQQEYDDFIALIAGILASDGVTQDDIDNCFAPPLVDPAFTSTIIGL